MAFAAAETAVPGQADCCWWRYWRAVRSKLVPASFLTRQLATEAPEARPGRRAAAVLGSVSS